MKKNYLNTIVSAATCGVSLWSSESNAAITYEDHFYDGGIATNTAPAIGNWQPSGYTQAMTESNSAVRWTAQGGWGWAGSSIASVDNHAWPTGNQIKSVEWKIGPMIVTADGNQTWGDVRFQCGLFSTAGSKVDAQLYPYVPGCIVIEIDLDASMTVAYARLQLKDLTDGANANGAVLAGQVNHAIDPKLGHILRLDLTETEVKYYVDNNLVGTALLADYDLGLSPVEPETGTEFSNGFFINNWGGRIDNGEGLVSLDRVTVRDSAAAVDIQLPVAPDYPSPTITLEEPVTGLHIINSESQYRRQTLRTTGDDYSWVDGDFPKTYSFTVTEAPAVPNYDVVMYFSPYADYPDNGPDYNRANCAILRLGMINALPELSFAYKLNSPTSNGPAGNNIYELDTVPSSGIGGKLATIASPSYLGTWSITFTSAENFTLTNPQMQTASGSMLAESSAYFVNPMIVGVGTFNPASDAVRANGANECIFSNITMSGVPSPFNETFVEPTYTELLTNSGDTLAANFVVGNGTKFMVTRNGGDSWWRFEQSTDLGATVPWTYVENPGNKPSFPVTATYISENPKEFWRLSLDAPLAPQAVPE